MPAHVQTTVTPLRGGPLHGVPAGFQYYAIPATAETNIAGGASEIDLLLPTLLQWWGKLLNQQGFTFIADKSCVGAISVYLAGQGPYDLYLSGNPAADTSIRAGDFIEMAWDAGLGAFQGVNWTTVGTGGGQTGNQVIADTAGPFVIAPTTSALILNKAMPSATAVSLGSVDDRGGLPLTISDFGNNAGDITVTPFGTEKIGGQASWIIGAGGFLTFNPNISLGGWFLS